MKKIIKFIAPNGEYVEWGNFDNSPSKQLCFEVKTFNDEGVLESVDSVEFRLPEKLGIESQWKVSSSYHRAGFRTLYDLIGNHESLRGDCGDVVDDDPQDPREILND